MVAMQLLHGSSASLDGRVSGRTRPKGAAQLYPKGLLVSYRPLASIFGRRRYLSAHSSIWRQAAIYNTIYSTSASSEASFTETVLWSGLATLARWRTRTTPICPAQSVGQQERQKTRPRRTHAMQRTHSRPRRTHAMQRTHSMLRRTHASASAKKRHQHRGGRRSTSPSSANGRGRRRRCRRRHRPQKPCRREHSRRREHRQQRRRARASTSAACGHCRRGRAP